MRKILTKYFREEAANSWPSAETERRKLPSVHKIQFEKLKSIYEDKKVAILADETTDSEQRNIIQGLQKNYLTQKAKN